MKFRFFAILALASPVFGAYSYYVTDSFGVINTGQWTQNGSVAAGVGLTSSSAGSLISSVTVPAPSASYEVKLTLGIQNATGSFLAYLRATTNALYTQSTATGTFYAVQVSPNSGTCALSILKVVSGSVSNPASTSVACGNGTTVRAVMETNTTIVVYVNNVQVLSTTDVFNVINSGQPGVGVINASSGNAISKGELGQLDTTAPNAVSSSGIAALLSPTRIELQWQGASDDTNGIGVYSYRVQHDGIFYNSEPQNTYSDDTVTAGSTHTYTVTPIDYHGNVGPATSITVTAPPAGSLDPRNAGIRPNGTYWGGAGEQIDMRSGNLNYTFPLLKAMSRGGWGAGFNLTYNSQNWTQDTTGTNWNLGRDVGYGYGWKLLAGALVPYYKDNFAVSHYIFMDSSGGEYRLNQNSGGVWYSTEETYLWYDSNTGRLYFRDGSFWVLGCTSAGAEQDAGTMYPTLMLDSNGNQISVNYNAGVQVMWGNSSARIQNITDVRNYPTLGTYVFNYNTDPIPHLTSVLDYGGGGAGAYTFTINNNQTLRSPFTHAVFGTTSFLQGVTQTNTSRTTSFGYDGWGAGEIVNMTTPYGGQLNWGYQTYALKGLSVREVQTRSVLMKPGATLMTYQMERDTGDSSRPTHLYARWYDWNGLAAKQWWFETNTAQASVGLATAYEGQSLSAGTLTRNDYTWAANSAGKLYVSSNLVTENSNATPVQKKTTQVVDGYGNVTQSQIYNYGNLTTPARTYNNAYITYDSNYVNRYIMDRLISSTVTDGTYTLTLAQNYYDNQATGGACGTAVLTDRVGISQHDATFNTGFWYRGNVSASIRPGATTCNALDIAGQVVTTTTNGVTTSVTTPSTNNYAAPTQVTTNSLSTNMSWTQFLGLSSQTGPNGDGSAVGYDGAARPSTSTSPFGATTTYAYNDAATPPNTLATTNGHWAQTSMDGFGRTIQSTTGDASGAKSNVDTQYAACGCSPLGKLYRVSQPYAAGGSASAWTTYAYDGIGRTLTQTAPDGSATGYAYASNTVQVTDAAGKWKNYAMDAFGNVSSVREPNPAAPTNPAQDLWTYYSYDLLNHLTGVSMPRGSVTQTRTFNYIDPVAGKPSVFLRSATNPENGTVSYTYNSDGTLASKTDAKSQVFTYGYDPYKRPVTVSVGGVLLRTFIYDTNTLDGSYSGNTLGRLAAVQHAANGQHIQFVEMYSYGAGGSVTKKRLQVNETLYYSGGSTLGVANLDETFTYNNEGAMTSVGYPSTIAGAGGSYNYTFDSMGRLSGMTDQSSATVVNGVSYGTASELLTMSFSGVNESRSYNSRLQLTGITAGSYMNMRYAYPAGPSNTGKVCLETDLLHTEQVSYSYDSLDRLAAASASTYTGSASANCTPVAGTASWGNSYGYDGFGNLTNKNVTAGTAPTLSVLVDGTTNRVSGPTYDANGNMTLNAPVSYGYDAENRMGGFYNSGLGTSESYGYDAQNKRVWKWAGTVDGNGNARAYTIYAYGPSGKRMGTYSVDVYTNGLGVPSLGVASGAGLAYFGGRLLNVQDRVGSARQGQSFYPYGEDKAGNPGGDALKFATYSRDGGSGLDYADQRFYASQWGRFMSPDPYRASGETGNPGSWNRYSYVQNDPVNRTDRTGLFIDPDECWNFGNCDDVGDGGGWGWIWGSGAATYLDPEYANGLISKETLKKRRDLRIAETIAAFATLITKGSEPSTWKRYPSFIREDEDCWEPNSSRSATYTRIVTYSLLDEFGVRIVGSSLGGISVTEGFPIQEGFNFTPSTWSRDNGELSANGTFIDFLTSGGGIAGKYYSGSALQTFSANGSFGISIPLDILGFGISNGVLYNTYSQYGVTINGQWAATKCTKFY